jgi:nickel/cobalt transporter (NicO) family protein
VRLIVLVLTVALVGLTVLGAANAAPSIDMAEPDVFARVIAQLFAWQRQFQLAMTEHLHDISAGGSWATWSLIAASFVYGVLHAAGPGHGKAVLSAYLLTQRAAVRRGVGLAFAASFCQGLVALAIVYGLVFLTGLVMSETQAVIRWVERASYALVVAIGVWLVWRALPGLVDPVRTAAEDHCHDGHRHQHGHAPFPAADERNGLLAMPALVLSIGLRPCSGAVIVLVFAQSVGVPWAGVAAVAAISLGTGLAVATLAFLAVNVRDWAGRMSWLESQAAIRFACGIGLLGGLAIGGVGLSLLSASFAPIHPLGL